MSVSIPTVVLGASGYVGGELLRLIAGHPVFSLQAAVSDSGAGKPIGVCGEMAGRPVEAMALLGIGYRRLSMSPGGVGPVKAMVRSLELGPLAEYMTQLRVSSSDGLRDKLTSYAQDHGILI